jgi:hypothetical protein
VAQVLDRALDALIAQLEKNRFGATEKPRPGRRPKPGGRHIPADVRRRVRDRDGDQCTFVGENGRRCQECRFLEFDHVLPVARGGVATPGNLRLRCRAHNQFAAEAAFGVSFMSRRRDEARRVASPPA